ncbi:hypothetical protein B0T26DRAFT_689955 [Lasiosphaeria miniovina]|uniref:Secreted protein n=1 Tax=Lasiosphaeria miniovina TaxID=1954250 RepID=A0AA40BII9_9PEZI|nr:uncharacterized protein B0T26DRAFT_689955 [Lasiosphaeria miniovina]KAK0734876.1 hypothetical protein B0T26DRAFT_689955 [Lasiosphaeria miniovina]
MWIMVWASLALSLLFGERRGVERMMARWSPRAEAPSRLDEFKDEGEGNWSTYGTGRMNGCMYVWVKGVGGMTCH